MEDRVDNKSFANDERVAIAKQLAKYEFDFQLEIQPVFPVKNVGAFGDPIEARMRVLIFITETRSLLNLEWHDIVSIMNEPSLLVNSVVPLFHLL